MEIDEGNLKQGLLGLVVTLVEIIRDALQHQAVRRMEGGSLTEEEIDRLGRALFELDNAIEEIKEEIGVAEAVKNIRDDLDRLVNALVGDFGNREELAITAPSGRLP